MTHQVKKQSVDRIMGSLERADGAEAKAAAVAHAVVRELDPAQLGYEDYAEQRLLWRAVQSGVERSMTAMLDATVLMRAGHQRAGRGALLAALRLVSSEADKARGALCDPKLLINE